MFFIVVLLISAFATIIDYGGGEFRYDRVLPKLLLMAVLINFSKTLIQLLIDVSQVVMLTFVNAFASAAAGNFVNALGLNTVISISEGAEPGSVNRSNMIVAYMLAIFMLGVMISVTLVLTGFIIFRIVGLWMAIILSPIAFLVTALPPKIAKSLGSISNDYWSRLSSLLTGGPVVAFFLWLTLAIVQQTNSAGGLGRGLGFDFGEGTAASFLSDVGNAPAIGSFIVGITLMMMALQQAVSAANSIGSSLLNSFTQKAQGAGQSLAKLGLLSPLLATKYAAKGVAGGTKAAYTAVDKRVDLTRTLSAKGLETIGRVPGVGDALRPTLAKGLTMRREEAAKEAAAKAGLMASAQKYATPDELKALGGTYSMRPSKLRTLGERAGSAKVAEILGSDALRDQEAKRNQGKHIEALKKSGMSEADAKAGSKVLSQKDAQREQRDIVQKRLALARSTGDQDAIDQIEAKISTSPMLATDADRGKIISDLAKDPSKFKDIGKTDAMSGELLTGFMMEHGWGRDSNGALQMQNAAAFSRFRESVAQSGNKALLSGLDAQRKFIDSSPGITPERARGLQHQSNPTNGRIQSFDVSMNGNNYRTSTNQAGAKVLETGKRVYSDKYVDAERALRTTTQQRQGGTQTTPAQNAQLARDFINNDGSVADYLANGKKDANDTVPMDTLSAEIQSGVGAARTSLAAGDTSAANQAINTTANILSQIDTPEMNSDKQVKLLSSFADGLRDSGTNTIDVSFLKRLNTFHPDVQKALVSAMTVLKTRADEIRSSSGTRTNEQTAVVELVDIIQKEIQTSKKGFSSVLVNAYTN